VFNALVASEHDQVQATKFLCLDIKIVRIFLLNKKRTCKQGYSRAWTEGNGVHSPLRMKWSVIYAFMYICDLADVWRPLTSYGVHPLLFYGLHPCSQATRISVT